MKVVDHLTKPKDSFVLCIIAPHPMTLMTISLFSTVKTEADEKLSFLLDIIWCICRSSVSLINVARTNNRK